MGFDITIDRLSVNGEMTDSLRKRILERQHAIGYLSYASEDPEWVDAVIPSLQVIPGIFQSEDEVVAFCVENFRGGNRPYNIAMRVAEVRPLSGVKDLSDKLVGTRFKRDAFLREVAPWNRSSRTFSCKGCGTRLVCEDLRRLNSFVCPTCGSPLLSGTNLQRLASLDQKIDRLSSDLVLAKRGKPTGKTYWLIECGYTTD